MKAVVLILGCWGRELDGLTICSGVSNRLLNIAPPTEKNKKIADILDGTYGLFDKPLYNNIHTALFSIQDKVSELNNPVFKPKYYKAIEEFCLHHRKCGLYLKLEIIDE